MAVWVFLWLTLWCMRRIRSIRTDALCSFLLTYFLLAPDNHGVEEISEQ